MMEEKSKMVSDCIRRLSELDAQAIDAIAKEVNTNQRSVYQLFIWFHEEIYRRMYGEEYREP